MPITGTVPLGGPIAPTSETDKYPVMDPKYGLGGHRTVQNETERNAIYYPLRQRGMLVYVVDDGPSGQFYTLIGGTSNDDWIVYNALGSGERGPEGPTGGSDAVTIRSILTDIPNLVVKGTSSYSLNGKGLTVAYARAGGYAPATASIYLTDPTKGTGFPVYFPTGAMDKIDFTSQTITAGIGESVTLRIHATGSDGSYDIYDHTVVVDNVFLWGGSTHENLTASTLSPGLTAFPAANPYQSFSLTANYGQYIFYAYPSRNGYTRQSLNNSAYGGMVPQGMFGTSGSQTANYTNDFGYAELYYVYRSVNQNLGRTSVQVFSA